MNEFPEAKVIARAIEGDQRSFERLVARWDGEVLNLAYRLTGNVEDARDIRQGAFLKAFRALAAFDGRSRFSTWLFRIVVNLSRDHQRSGRSREGALRSVWESSGESLSTSMPTNAAGGSAAHATRDEMGALVAAAVASLPRAQREVLVLRHYHDVPMADIARVLDVPVTTARSRLGQALTRLRERLERHERDAAPASAPANE